MQNDQSKETYMRLKRVLLNDKTLPGGLISVLTADLTDVLLSYFDYDPAALTTELDMDKDGKYILRIEAPIDRVKNVKVI